MVERLRSLNYNVDFDMTNKKFTKQLEKAAKSAKFSLILGEDEISGEYVTLKNLDTAKQTEFSLQNLREFEEQTYKYISVNSEEWQKSKLSLLSSGFVIS